MTRNNSHKKIPINELVYKHYVKKYHHIPFLNPFISYGDVQKRLKHIERHYKLKKLKKIINDRMGII